MARGLECVTDHTFGKGQPCPRGAYYVPLIAMPRIPPKPRELGPEERAAKRAASDRASAAAAVEHNRLLTEGMLDWQARARQKWLRAGGYGFRLTAEQESEIRAAGFEPAPRDR